MRLFKVLCLLPLATVISCKSSQPTVSTESSYSSSYSYTKQNLDNTYRLNIGMTEQEVISFMGTPIVRFNGKVDEWHYCSSGTITGKYFACWFYEGKLVSTLNYTVTLQDENGASGSCENFVRRGTYRVPTEVAKLQ